MVSFSCEACGDVLTKKKLDTHKSRCRGATFTCLDCMVHFPGVSYRSHTSCITEDQKYQGALYKNKRAKVSATAPSPPRPTMPQTAFVEDVPEDDFQDYEDYNGDDSDNERSANDAPPPQAPSPPPADQGNVNVFDFLVASTTPNASTTTFPRDAHPESSTQLVRFDYDANTYLDSRGYRSDGHHMVQYGSGPVPSSAYETPAPRGDRKRAEGKKDKKRKRLHIETDQIMTDAPPELHSGLTGGLSRMMRPVFPPSPDYSGGDAAEASPASPLKKSRHSKHSKSGREGLGNNLLSLMTGSKKTKKRKVATKRHHHRSDAEKAPKLLEYRPHSKDGKEVVAENSQVVVYRPRVDLLFSFIDKGPESERGCSMNKALKRFHRERSATGESLGKHMEEKELWRSLRMRRNDRGEIVLFSI